MGIINLTFLLWLSGCALWGTLLSWAANSIDDHHEHISEECRFTRHPTLCVETLQDLGSLQHVDIISALVNKAISETKWPSSNFATLGSEIEVEDISHAHHVTGYCERLMNMSMKRLYQSHSAIIDSPIKNKHDIQTWLSAALTFQQACKDSINSLNLSLNDPMMGHISQKMDYLSRLASNPLALVNRITNTGKANFYARDRHLTEENMFPHWISKKNRKLLQGNTIKANAIVAQDGTGNYKTVSAAIQAASGNHFVIYVKAGVYKEKIHINKDAIVLIGDGKDATIITGDDSASGGSSMPGSATFTISGDNFVARDISFQNTAGPGAGQALALNIASDRSVFFRCSISGYQDTLYALALRQFYSQCDIYGTIDFIFGNAAAIFQNCNIVMRQKGIIMANGRSNPDQTTGFVLQRCKISGASGGSYLGRPWKQYSRAIVMQSSIDGAIASQGWADWPGAKGNEKSLYFGEFQNVGAGANVGGRVKWPGFHVLGIDEAVQFTVGKFIAGTSWLPSTGAAFVSGL